MERKDYRKPATTVVEIELPQLMAGTQTIGEGIMKSDTPDESVPTDPDYEPNYAREFRPGRMWDTGDEDDE